MKKWFVMGMKDISKYKWKDVKNNWINKPLGGLWASEFTPNCEYISPWAEWCDNEMPEWVKDYGVVFGLKDCARVYVIDSYEDLICLYNKYNTGKFIDYEKASQEYDCIYLTDKGQWETRLSDINLYGWDIECILVLNFESINKNSIVKVEKGV